MDNVFNLVTSFVSKMTSLFMTMLSFGIMAEILFGGPMMGLSVISNIMDLINMLGSNGVIGLITLVVLFGLLNKE
ncbi:MAG: hypothetical protein GOVbin1709_6 [Prokaryotic dsDNA virus sp.]|nr:MAG: hypothetical protein GOVbin1709_6 [Prokaryotic dsDNA virus sp.]|tara:strand:- start:462 stop:686 length:225 start_codon:yes stop_codon:yes gene_type:complete